VVELEVTPLPVQLFSEPTSAALSEYSPRYAASHSCAQEACMQRVKIVPLMMATCLLLGGADAGRRSGGSFGGRSSSSRSYSAPRTYTAPRTSIAPRSYTPPRVVRVLPRTTTARRTPVPPRPRAVIVHHTTYSSAFPYFFLGYYWPHPRTYYPSDTVFVPVQQTQTTPVVAEPVAVAPTQTAPVQPAAPAVPVQAVQQTSSGSNFMGLLAVVLLIG